MGINDYNDLNNMHLDVLKEIGNIGTGNAVTSLSAMLQRPINIEVPIIRMMDVNEVSETLGGPETMMVGMLLTMKQDMTGMMMFLMKEDFAHLVLGSLLGQSFADFAAVEADEMGMSAMQEIGNIMAASYVNAISQLTGMTIDISPPDVTIDMAGALLSVPAIYFANISDQVLFIEDKFDSGQGKDEGCSILMIPDVDSLRLLMERLGAAYE